MKLLLDESLPRRLKNEFSQHEVTTVPERGWSGKTNGELLELASTEFDVFITADQGIEYQQNLADFDIAVMVLVARTNRLDDLKPLIPATVAAIEKARPGTVTRVGD